MDMKKIVLLSVFIAMLSACVTTTSDTEEVKRKPGKKNLTLAAQYNTELGLAYLNKGNVSRAKMKLLAALSQDPRSLTVLNAVAYFYEQTHEEKLADSYYRKALSYAPRDGKALNNYGAFLCRQGQYKQAEIYFQQAVKDQNYLSPADAYENAALCALQAKKDKDAEHYFTLTLQQDPRRLRALYYLANFAYLRGDYPKAKAFLQRYASYEPLTGSVAALAMKLRKK